MSETNGLPQGWIKVSIGEVVEIISGYGFPEKYQGKIEGDIPFFKVADISKAVKSGSLYLTQAQHYISFNECAMLKAKPLKKGTIVFAKIGEAIKLNRRAILGQESLIDNNVMGLFSFSEGLNKSFLFHFFLTVKLGEISQATTVPSLRKSDIEQILISLPPLPEQQRIVAKIEELFTKLDAGVDALKTARAQLVRYRQAVLKAAVSGELTREWREAHGAEHEPAADLLARILRERRAKWEADQLAKMQAVGKPPKNDDWKKKYQEPAAPDTSELPEVPEGWTWTTVDQLASCAANAITDGPFGSNLKSAHYTDSGPRVIRLQNIGDGVFIDEYAHISEEHYQSLVKHRILAGDLVIASLGEVAPRSCIIPEYVGAAIVKADCIRVNPNNELAVTEYINYSLNSDPTRKRTGQAIHGVGRPRLGLGGIRQIALPLPPLGEQQQIVSEVERLLSIADATEQTIAQSLKQSERMRQSILQQAFAGKLVPQDLADEPADVLLARIREERAEHAAATPKKAKGRTPKRRGAAAHDSSASLFPESDG